MGSRTTRLRVLLAVLAGALTAPVSVTVLLTFVGLTDRYAWDAQSLTYSLTTFLPALLLATIIGSPVALISIIVLFGPLWFALHKAGGSFRTFMLAGTAAGFVMACPFAVISSLQSAGGGLMILLVLTVAAIPTTAVLWLVAYGRKGRQPSQPL